MNKEKSVNENEFTYIDPEEELPFFTIKKKVFKLAERRIVTESIPILLGNLLKVNITENFPSIMKINGLWYRKVIIYGRCVPIGMHHKTNVTLYSVDDGTGSITVHFQHLQKKDIPKLTNINNLKTEIGVSKKNGIPLLGPVYGKKNSAECKSLIKDMEIILKKIQKNTYIPENNTFKHGTKVWAIGAVYTSKIDSKRHFWAYEMMEDGNQNRDKEIFFKKCIIRRSS